MLATWTQKLRQTLVNHYSVQLQVPFRQFRNGLIYFAVGFGCMMMAVVYMPPSPRQESIVLFGLLLGAVGFLMAMTAQMRLLIARIYQFFSGPPQATPKSPTKHRK